MRWLALVVVAACSRGGSERSQPQVTPPPAPPAPLHARVVACSIAEAPPQVDDPPTHAMASGYGVGGCGGHGRTMALTPFKLDMGTVAAGLAPEVVRRYLKRNTNKLLYCFEKHALAEPGFAAAAQVELEIGGDGHVANASASHVHPDVADCLASVVKEIELPKPTAVPVKASATLTYGDPAHAAASDGHVAWTPFQIGAHNNPQGSFEMVAHTRAAVEARLAQLDACFGQATGSVRALVRIGDGHVTLTRAGGLGDRGVETCIEAALQPLVVPGADAIEVACDLARGDDVPWRVTKQPGWLEIDVARDGARIAGETQLLETAGKAYLDDHQRVAPGALVVADREASGTAIAKAAAWVNGFPIVVVAIADPPRAPRFLALAHSSITHGINEHRAHQAIAVAGKGVRTCRDGKPTGDLMALVGACTGSCGSVTLALEDATVPDIVAAADAARSAGVTRLVVDTLGCP